MKVKVISASIADRGPGSGSKSLENQLNAFLEAENHPLIEHVTHVVHANAHHITVWYVGGIK